MKKAIWIIVFIVIAVGGVMAFNIYNQQQEAQSALSGLETVEAASGTLTATIGATGTVRANQSADLTWQTSGAVDAVNIQAGDVVANGEVLASLEQTSLSQNVILAQADLVSAQKALDDLLNSQLQSAQALLAVEDAEQALEDALDPELAQAQASEAIVQAQDALDEAQLAYDRTLLTASQANIDDAYADMLIAQDGLERAQENFDKYADKPVDNINRAHAQSSLSSAQQKFDNAAANYNAMIGTSSEQEQALAAAELTTAQAQLAEAQKEYERIKDGPSDGEIALLEAQLDDARREWERLQDGPDPEDVAAAESRVAAAEATLAQVRLTAPFDGVVTLVESKPGDQIKAGSVAFRVDDVSQLLVDLEVSEVDINQVAVGQPVVLTFDAILAAEYQGEVIDVALVGAETQGVVNFTVTVALSNPDENIRPGMTSAVSIITTQVEADLIVPNRAVRVVDGERVVYVMDPADGSLQQVEITLGATSNSYSQIVAGELQAGDLIVLNPPSEFSMGDGPGSGGGPFGGGQ